MKIRPPARTIASAQPGQIAERVELRLARKAQAGPVSNARQRRARADALDVGEAGAVRGLELALEQLRLVAGREEQVAVDAREVAVDLLARTISSMRAIAASWLPYASWAPRAPCICSSAK